MVDFGFGEKVDPDWITNRYFSSKIGGRPAWLDLLHLPKDLICNRCKSPKSFLCQIYAAYDDAYNFHRTIYIFICRSPECQKANVAKNITVLRSQLPRINEFYSEDPPNEDGKPLPAISAKNELCLVCGCFSSKLCGRCWMANYCSIQHQKVHWQDHKTICKPQNTTKCMPLALNDEILKGIVFPEWEIIMEQTSEVVEQDNDDDDDDDDDEADEQRRCEEFAQMQAASNTGSLSHLPSNNFNASMESVKDKVFFKFRKEIEKDPKQVIRYQRGATPLWIADPSQTISTQLIIPDCPWCKAPRQFEFQVMPQMLNLIDDFEIDWGILAVYTCAKSCDLPKDVQYVEEYVIKQDIN